MTFAGSSRLLGFRILVSLVPVFILLCEPLSGSIALELPLPVSIRDCAPPVATEARGLALLRLKEGEVLAGWLQSQGGTSWLFVTSIYKRETGRWSTPARLPLCPDFAPEATGEWRFSLLGGGRLQASWGQPCRRGAPTVSMYCISNDNGVTWRSIAAKEAGAEEVSAGQAWFGPAGDPLLFPDGTRLSLFRAGRRDGLADAAYARQAPGAQWGEPALIAREGWSTGLDEAGDLHFSMLAPRVSVAWFTAAGNEARILVSQSPDAGLRWTADRRCDLGKPSGPPDLVMTADASLFVAWREEQGADASQPAGYYLRRIASNASSIAPALLFSVDAKAPASPPRIALLSDDPMQPQELLVLHGGENGLRGVLVRLPERKELEEADQSCRCAPSIGAGVMLRARLRALDVKAGRLVLEHGPVPGLFAEGCIVLSASDPLAGFVEGQDVLAVLVPTGDGWRLGELRSLR